jgi:long-chain acyl-CoA synthetase
MTLAVAPRDVAAERAAIEATIAGRTLVGAFADTVERLGAAEALAWKEDGAWRALTWLEYRQAVAEVALGLVGLGLQPHQFTVLMSRNRPEPMIADLGTQHARGVPVFLYNTLAPEQVAYIAGHCDARVAFVEDRHFLGILRQVKDQLPQLEHVVLIEGEPEPGDDGRTMTWAELRAAGRRALAAEPSAFDALWRQVRPDDLAAVIYTSGTTGRPKGVMISQRNVLWEAGASEGFNPARPGERIISYLPLAHATGRWVDLWSQVVFGTTVYCCPDPTQVFHYALEVHPTVMVGVPRVWEKLYAALQAGIAAEPDAGRRQAVEWAIGVGRELVRRRQAGLEPTPDLAEQAPRAAAICQALRAKVGLDACERAYTGAAPIDPGIIEFFQAIGVPMSEAWGMTELTCAATGAPAAAQRNGTIGLAGHGVEMKLAEDGEILVRGGCVMQGYYKDPEATAATIDADGWLHTGDLGSVDADGYYQVIGRKKEIIITAGGKNIAPAAIEYLLQQHPLIGQALAIGDRRPYVAALLVLDGEVAPLWARQHGLGELSLAQLSEHPRVLEEVQRAVDEANTHLARVEQVKRFRLLPGEWTTQTGELTPTLKRRRDVIIDKYARDVEDLYR